MADFGEDPKNFKSDFRLRSQDKVDRMAICRRPDPKADWRETGGFPTLLVWDHAFWISVDDRTFAQGGTDNGDWRAGNYRHDVGARLFLNLYDFVAFKSTPVQAHRDYWRK